MEIERINENTVKFYISYVDIENRGFEREEIWYNRERSEQLFWQMMDEVNYKEDFVVEGPLWIQVQALEKGLEIIVTKAQIPSEGMNIDAIEHFDNFIDITLSDKSKSTGSKLRPKKDQEDEEQEKDDSSIWMTAEFKDFEDVIQLSHYFNSDYENEIVTVLYNYDDKYYLYLEISEELFENQEDVISQILEFSTESSITHHVLDEYGTIIVSENVFQKIKESFK